MQSAKRTANRPSWLASYQRGSGYHLPGICTLYPAETTAKGALWEEASGNHVLFEGRDNANDLLSSACFKRSAFSRDLCEDLWRQSKKGVGLKYTLDALSSTSPFSACAVSLNDTVGEDKDTRKLADSQCDYTKMGLSCAGASANGWRYACVSTGESAKPWSCGIAAGKIRCDKGAECNPQNAPKELGYVSCYANEYVPSEKFCGLKASANKRQRRDVVFA
jgi:hypothetical protein